MKQTTPLVITISRQLGSGGAYIGQQLAKELDLFYADREIIHEVAQRLSLLDEDLELRDEKRLSFWQSFLEKSAADSGIYIPPQMMFPTDHELFKAEAEIIEHIVKEHSAVIIGRCGFHILDKYPNHVKIFLYGETAFRSERIQKLYNVSKIAAEKMIVKSDKDRALYCKTFTGKEWPSANNYDICVDTSKIDVDKSVELILYYLKLNHGEAF